MSVPPCFIEGCDKPARTGVLLRPDQGGRVTYRCDEHLTSFGTDSWKCGSDTPPRGMHINTAGMVEGDTAPMPGRADGGEG